MKVGDIVVWHAQTSQRLAAIVTATHKDGSLNLKVRSDTPEDVWSGEGADDAWAHLHRNVQRGNAEIDPVTRLQAAQTAGFESWLLPSEVQINKADPNDQRLEAQLATLTR